MIGIVEFWETVQQSGKTGTSGYQSKDEFNRDLHIVQLSAFGTLSPFYSKNQQVQDLLSYRVKTVAIGARPDDYGHFVSATVNGKASHPINVNQKDMIMSSPIRRPTRENGLCYHYFEGNNVHFLVGSNVGGTMTYLSLPKQAEIDLEEFSDEDSDYVTPVSVSDLEWPQTAYNLLLNLMLERVGLERKEQILMEYSQLGIQRESIKVAD